MTPFQKLILVALKPEWSFLKSHYSLKRLPTAIPLFEFQTVPGAALLQLGLGPDAAEKTLTTFFKGFGAASSLHFGLSGSLSDDVLPEDLFLADEIVNETGDALSLPASPLKESDIKHGRLFTSNVILKNETQKRKAADEFSAQTVDMESYGVAKLCQAHDCRYTSLRGVFDAVTDDVAAMEGVHSEAGNLKPTKFVANLVQNPKLIFQLPSFARRLSKIQKKAMPYIGEFVDSRLRGNDGEN